MRLIAGRFFKVPEEEFKKYEGVDYADIKIPERSTKGSSGFDFFSTVDIKLQPGESALIKTGICCEMGEGWYLAVYPRSGYGFKCRMQLDNTVGIIDQDYYGNEKNFGHIMIKITNDSKEGKVLEIPKGGRFVQGIFSIYGMAANEFEADTVMSKRTGGMGSTGM